MAVIPKFWYEPGRIPSILEGFIPGWKESFQDGRNPSGVEIHILYNETLKNCQNTCDYYICE